MNWLSIDSNDILWGLVRPFIGPAIIFIIGIVIFSYLLSIGKRSSGVYIGVALILVAIAWLIMNFVG